MGKSGKSRQHPWENDSRILIKDWWDRFLTFEENKGLSFWIPFNAPLSHNQPSPAPKPKELLSIHVNGRVGLRFFLFPLWHLNPQKRQLKAASFTLQQRAKIKYVIWDMKTVQGETSAAAQISAEQERTVDNKNTAGLSCSTTDRQEQQSWTCTGFNKTQWALLLRNVGPR